LPENYPLVVYKTASEKHIFLVGSEEKRFVIIMPEARMEIYLTIEEMAAYLKLAEQTIRRWVLNREIPYRKIKKVIRFRVSEIETWIDNGGLLTASQICAQEGNLFNEAVSHDEMAEQEMAKESHEEKEV